MLLNVLKLCLILVYCCEHIDSKECEDCVPVRSCYQAIQQAKKMNDETKMMFRNAFCGIEMKNNRKLLKVCCTDFTSQPDIDDIDKHPNFSLLPKACGHFSRRFIFDANLDELSWFALISYVTESFKGHKTYNFGCGGSIINPRYILTGAHCVQNRKVAGVRIGSQNCQGKYEVYPPDYCKQSIQDLRIKKKIVHPEYQSIPFFANDIALLRLYNVIDFSLGNVQPICLPMLKSDRNIKLAGKRGTIIDSGYVEKRYTSNRQAQVLSQSVRSDDLCKNFYGNSDTANGLNGTFCAYEDGKYPCADTGGPFMVEQDNESSYRMIQYGILSNSLVPCDISIPSIYTDITRYLKWILDNIEP